MPNRQLQYNYHLIVFLETNGYLQLVMLSKGTFRPQSLIAIYGNNSRFTFQTIPFFEMITKKTLDFLQIPIISL